MGLVANFLFEVGYFPIEHQSVKNSFLQWYYQATLDESIIEGLNVDNSQLVNLTLDAASAAERMDCENPALALINSFDDHISRMKIGLAYLAVGFFFLGATTVAVSIYTIDQDVIRWIGISIGSTVGLPAVIISALYKIFEHQIRSNSELVAKFNQELVERPGQVRRHERDWNRLAAKYFWNMSLSRPQTIIVLLLLSIVKVARPGLYGNISGELHNQIREFIGEDARTIMKMEMERALSGEFGPTGTRSDPQPAPLSNSPRDDESF